MIAALTEVDAARAAIHAATESLNLRLYDMLSP
jgi:hypothetical protein